MSSTTVWVKTDDGRVGEVSLEQARHLIQLGHAVQVPAPKSKTPSKASSNEKPTSSKS